MRLMEYFYRLLEIYGPRGWWPLPSRAGKAGRDDRGYLPGYYDLPDREGAFEIAAGAILTQNTAWINAERALMNLAKTGLLSPSGLSSSTAEAVALSIQSSGYFNSKARKLKECARFFLGMEETENRYVPPSRDGLLAVWGIGPETADSILLYAFGVPVFVVDTYTRRILGRLGVESATQPYEALREWIEGEIDLEIPVCNEFHALLVEHAKRTCRQKPLCGICELQNNCRHSLSTYS